MVDLGYFFTTLLSYYLPIPEGMVKMQMAMAIGQLLGQLCEPIKKWISELDFWNKIYMKNHITIESNHPHYDSIINHLYTKFNNQIKGANMNHREGKKKMLIEVLQISSLKDNDIEISFGELPKEENKEANYTEIKGKKIIFSSSKSLSTIEEYVSEVVKECCRKKNNTITTYSLDITKSEKSRTVHWKQKVSTSNKTIKNTIVRSSVKETFYDDLTRFMDSEDLYKTRGISFKRGYLLYGIPGSGKSSMVAAIANEYGFPVFKMDMSILESNEELTRAENIIYDYIGPFDPHILLIEDFDRSKVFDRDYDGNSKSKITMDCILNILDGIEQTYGRIVIVTANNVRRLRQNTALIRPGRIDRMIEIDYCDQKQITDILRLYFDKEAEISDEVELTPANLNKIIQVVVKFEDIVNFINRFNSFSSGEEIERLAVVYKDNPVVEDDRVEEIREEAEEIVKTRRSRNTRSMTRKKKIKLPWGGQQLERYERDISRLKSGDVTLKEISARGWRDKNNINKVHKGDSIDIVQVKMEGAKQQNLIKLQVIEGKKKKLIEKMKSRDTWDDYISIKYKKDHQELYKKIILEYKKTWELYEGVLSRVGFRMSRAPDRHRNFRDLSKPEDYDSLPSRYFYTMINCKNNKELTESQKDVPLIHNTKQ